MINIKSLKKRTKQRSLISIFVIALALLVTGCGGDTEEKVLRVTDNQFDSQNLHNAIAKIVVEHGFDGYTFETSTGSSTMNWQSIKTSEIDLDIESWTQNVATYEQDKADGDILDVGVLVPDSQQGYYVPRYVIEGDAERGIEPMAPDLKTVADLKNYPELFPDDEDPTKGRVYGGIPGWMIDEVLFAKFEYHQLGDQFNYFRVGNEAALFASLYSAYNRGQAWVGYCYEPTWIAGKLDLVRLTDAPYDPEHYEDGQTDFPSQELKIVSSKEFADKFPELVPFFENFTTGSELVSEALAYMDDNDAGHEGAAIWLLKNNDSLLDDWLDEEQAQNVRDYLGTVD